MIIEQNIKIFVFLKHPWSVYIITIILQNGFFIKLFAEHTTGNKTFSNEDFLMQEVSNTRTVPKSAKIIDKEFWNVRRPLTHLHLTVLIKVGLNASFNHL